MISTKYKNIYEGFIEQYEKIHINPWHEITKEELNNIVNELVSKMDINDIYSFKYFIDYIIKRLSGASDAHTKSAIEYSLPINFRIFNDDILVNYPENLKNSKLVSINGIKIEKIIGELEEVITYGTKGKRRNELEKYLFNSIILFGLPSLRKYEELDFRFLTLDGKEITKTFKKDEEYKDGFDYDRFLYGDNTNFRIEEDILIYKHSSVQPKFKEQIESAVNSMRKLDLSNINTIIIDLRGNTGGNSAFNQILMDFLSEHKDKMLVTLTDYRVFSAGRYALKDLINLGSITIGEEIGTPINCYGNSNWVSIDNTQFSISERYFHPLYNIGIKSKEEFNSKITEDILTPYIFKPDIVVEETEEDYILGIDTILEYAKNYVKQKQKKL